MEELKQLHAIVAAEFPEARTVSVNVVYDGTLPRYSAQIWATEIREDGILTAIAVCEPSVEVMMQKLHENAQLRAMEKEEANG